MLDTVHHVLDRVADRGKDVRPVMRGLVPVFGMGCFGIVGLRGLVSRAVYVGMQLRLINPCLPIVVLGIEAHLDTLPKLDCDQMLAIL